MTTSPISITVLLILLLALSLAYCAGAYATGVYVAVCLISATILAVLAVFIEAANAYSEGVEIEREGEE